MGLKSRPSPMPLGIRKEISRSSILEDKPTWVQAAKNVIFSTDLYIRQRKEILDKKRKFH
jgi:hypothetical protein